MTMDISKSIFSLAKYNNGYFKSEKQSKFLRKILEEGAVAGGGSAWGNTVTFDVTKFDENGIIEIVKHYNTTNKEEIYFQRKIKGQLTEPEIKKLKKLKRRLKKLVNEFDATTKSFETGDYNGSGDPSTYTESMIELYNSCRENNSKRIEDLKSYINEIENS